MQRINFEMPVHYQFASIGIFKHNRKTVGYLVPCPFDIESLTELDFLLGCQITIDERLYRCDSIEINMQDSIKKGGQIAVWVSSILVET